MPEQKIKVEVSISRNSSDEITFRFDDKLSRAQFLAVKMTPHDFAMAITGLSYIECDAVVRALEYVGKQKVTEQRTVEYTGPSTYDREAMGKWLKDTQQEDGWHLSTYLGSQSSVDYKDGKTLLNYHVYKFVEPTETLAQLIAKKSD